jgi:tRNA(Arg) A34 adenosine deaminase TadA
LTILDAKAQEAAPDRGEIPVGAVIVIDNRSLLQERPTQQKTLTYVAYAEMITVF